MSWMVTNSGKKFDFKRVSAKNICLQDIAHSLSYTCRYNGQCHAFYSVAEHAMNMADYILRMGLEKDGEITQATLARADQALLHDAAEAYCGDMVSPLKAVFPEFKEYEHKLMFKIFKKYHLGVELHPFVKEADTRIMLNEKARLFPPDHPLWGWEHQLAPLEGVVINCFSPPDIYPVYHQVLKERFGQYD